MSPSDRVERFKLHPLRNSGFSLNPCSDGEYMRFEDHQRLLLAAEAQVRLLRERSGPKAVEAAEEARVAAEGERDDEKARADGYSRDYSEAIAETDRIDNRLGELMRERTAAEARGEAAEKHLVEVRLGLERMAATPYKRPVVDDAHRQCELLHNMALEILRLLDATLSKEEPKICDSCGRTGAVVVRRLGGELGLTCPYRTGCHPNAPAVPAPEESGDEDCSRCGGSREIPTGECKVAMSGPTCFNAACPPCRFPETEPCPDCTTKKQPAPSGEWPSEIRLVRIMDFGVVLNYAAEPTHKPEPSEPFRIYVPAETEGEQR